MTHKKTYYIEIGSGEISQSATNSTWNFKIEATDFEIQKLREQFDLIDANEPADFLRAHIPFKEYHFDRENDFYDQALHNIYQMIYRLGDDEARKTIDEMGILRVENESFDC
nr:hydrolase [uncultured Bacillus sp.]